MVKAPSDFERWHEESFRAEEHVEHVPKVAGLVTSPVTHIRYVILRCKDAMLECNLCTF